MQPDTRPAAGWWNDFFDDIFAEVVLDRPDPSERAQTLAFLVQCLKLPDGGRLFDQCCGTGSVSHIFAGAGYHAHGVDIIPSYIARAKDIAQKSGLAAQCDFTCADGRDFVPAQTCDAAINWYTSFGYSPDDSDNMRMLHCAARAVKSGGFFALDLTNMAASLRQADKESVYTRDTSIGKVTVTRRYWFDVANGMRGSHWHYILPDGTVKEKSGQGRLYAPREISAMLGAAGFENTVFFGDMDGSALGLDSPRCICVAQRRD